MSNNNKMGKIKLIPTYYDPYVTEMAKNATALREISGVYDNRPFWKKIWGWFKNARKKQ